VSTILTGVLVAAGILVLHRIDPDRPRPFRAPWVPWVPLGAIATCAWLMRELPTKTWMRFFFWLIAGLIIYFLYGFRRSRMGEEATPRRERS
jgi:APA family basic amino acid/polyamine antiporter